MKRMIAGPAALAVAVGSILPAGKELYEIEETEPDHDWIEPVRYDIEPDRSGKRHRQQVRAAAKPAEVLFETRQQRRAKERAERKAT